MALLERNTWLSEVIAEIQLCQLNDISVCIATDKQFFLSFKYTFHLQVITIPKFFDRCCNPFNLDKHLKKSSLRNLPEYLAVQFYLSTNDRVCSACYKKLLYQYTENLPEDTDDELNESFETDEYVHDEIIPVEESPDTFASSSLSAMSLSTTLLTRNDALVLSNQSPVAAKRTSETYLDDEVNRVAQSLRKALAVKNYINPEFSYSDADQIKTV
ncbi:hypothetical protein KQX54_011602 [Cotesia glomerata]|uniref:Uncharacterized protein n=1 Tax=Cotesia glomerata TaxID=32391 RepID=A0AAV7HU96_COTGL|nr:hypothetical protein KQX54_011602 [Cotesia glomerata]